MAALVFWTLVFAMLVFQFFFAVRARLGSNILKSIRKCLIIFIDNPGFAVFVLLINIAALLASTLIALIFPGPCGALLFTDEALRLRLFKYDWLEVNPGADRRRIPWDELLAAERERTGTRTLKELIFPWRE